MKRIALVLLAALVASLAVIAPAQASRSIDGPGPAIPQASGAPSIKPCVTTTWRSHYWHRPKTKRGERCYATPDMWVSRYWPQVGVLAVGRHVYPVYRRTV